MIKNIKKINYFKFWVKIIKRINNFMKLELTNNKILSIFYKIKNLLKQSFKSIILWLVAQM